MEERFLRFPEPDQVIFTVNGHPFTCAEMLFANWLSGSWGEFVSELKLKLAARRYNQRYELVHTSDLVRERVTEFRYEKGLESSKECQAWLARRGVSLNDLTAYLERTVLLQKLGDLSEQLSDFIPEESELVQCVPSELLLSGALDEFADQFAKLCCHYSEEVQRDAANVMGIRLDPEELDKFALLANLERVSEEIWIERAALFTALKNRSDHYCLKRITKKALQDVVTEHQLEWTWVDYTAAVFSKKSGADEAVLALRAEKESLITIAREAEIAVRRLAHLLDHEPAGISDSACKQLMSASDGEVIGPIECENEYLVMQLKQKCTPTAESAEIKKLAENLARNRMLSKLVEEKVQWSS